MVNGAYNWDQLGGLPQGYGISVKLCNIPSNYDSKRIYFIDHTAIKLCKHNSLITDKMNPNKQVTNSKK